MVFVSDQTVNYMQSYIELLQSNPTVISGLALESLCTGLHCK